MLLVEPLNEMKIGRRRFKLFFDPPLFPCCPALQSRLVYPLHLLRTLRFLLLALDSPRTLPNRRRNERLAIVVRRSLPNHLSTVTRDHRKERSQLSRRFDFGDHMQREDDGEVRVCEGRIGFELVPKGSQSGEDEVRCPQRVVRRIESSAGGERTLGVSVAHQRSVEYQRGWWGAFGVVQTVVAVRCIDVDNVELIEDIASEDVNGDHTVQASQEASAQRAESRCRRFGGEDSERACGKVQRAERELDE